MRKFFLALFVALSVLLFSATEISQARNCPLSDIGAYRFFEGMGYIVPCERYQTLPNGNLLFTSRLPKEPLVISGNLANVYVIVEPVGGKLFEVNLFFNANASSNAIGNVVATAMQTIESENAWQVDRNEFVNCLSKLLNSPLREAQVAYPSDLMGRYYFLAKNFEANGRVLKIAIAAGVN